MTRFLSQSNILHHVSHLLHVFPSPQSCIDISQQHVISCVPWFNLKELVCRDFSKANILVFDSSSKQCTPHGLASQGCDDAVRTKPLEVDDNGHVFWKLKCYNEEPNILVQELGNWSEGCPQEKWSAFTPEQKLEIEKYIPFIRMKRRREEKNSKAIPESAILVSLMIIIILAERKHIVIVLSFCIAFGMIC